MRERYKHYKVQVDSKRLHLQNTGKSPVKSVEHSAKRNEILTITKEIEAVMKEDDLPRAHNGIKPPVFEPAPVIIPGTSNAPPCLTCGKPFGSNLACVSCRTNPATIDATVRTALNAPTPTLPLASEKEGPCGASDAALVTENCKACGKHPRRVDKLGRTMAFCGACLKLRAPRPGESYKHAFSAEALRLAERLNRVMREFNAIAQRARILNLGLSGSFDLAIDHDEVGGYKRVIRLNAQLYQPVKAGK